MKEITLTQGKVAIVDDEDFERINAFKWYAHHNAGYWRAVREVRNDGWRGGLCMQHLVLMPLKGYVVDHIDGNALNNTRGNLRYATVAQNRYNSSALRNSTSRFKGVNWCSARGRWEVFIKSQNKSRFIGRFDDEEDAALAYNVAAQLYFGEFARLNPV